jgi:hypothetical protein
VRDASPTPEFDLESRQTTNATEVIEVIEEIILEVVNTVKGVLAAFDLCKFLPFP